MGRRRNGNRPSHKDDRDPIAEYEEWTDHRYDPGYYTGGRMPPSVRFWQKALSRKEKRVFLIVLILLLASLIVLTLRDAF
jgi:hypothetical protein